MARAIIAIGSAGNDGTGDTLRAGAIKINNNFAEVYQDLAAIGLLVNDSVGGLDLEGISFDQRSVVFIGADSPNSTPADNNETYLRAVEPTKDNIIILPDSSGNVALTADIPTNVSSLTNDAGYITGAGAGIDSAAALTLISDNSIDSIGTINLIDAPYIQARQSPSGLDSTHTGYFIDAYVTKNYLVSREIVLDSGDVIDIIDSQLSSYLDSVGFNNLAQALEVSLIPNVDNTRALGTNTKRFTDAFLKNSLEIDSAKFTYIGAFDLLRLDNVKTLKLDDGTDSGFFAVGSVGISASRSFVPTADSSLDLGSSSFKWRDLYLSGNTINLGSAKISAVGGAIRHSLPIYDSVGVVPTGGTAGDLIIIANADSATGGPSIAFKDSNNGNYITYATAGTPGGGGGGGF
jgi:hypothetical protein